ncbi:MAG: helix-turn-helix domain-containing protein [Acidobacteriia bacterium]|jgi:excisionase family DNA binding protein|nr:helix-turn-helix domain-containing protein [Terriglobia bacterium]
MHPRTLRTKARRGSIPAVQVGKRWRFRASTLDRWLGKLAS